MASQLLSLTLTSLFLLSLSLSFGPKPARSETEPNPSFAFGWMDDKGTFLAGDIATIKVKLLGNYEREKYKYAFNPNITVNAKLGNSSLISGVSSDLGGNPSDWNISFIPIMVGSFNVLITDENFNILDSSLHFQVMPGKIHPAVCVVSWLGQVNEFVAGARGTVLIRPKDAFGNDVPATSDGKSSLNYTVSASFVNGSTAKLLNTTYMGSIKSGHFSIEFTAVSAGLLLLNVEEKNESLNGSPLPFMVYPGALDVSNCEANWRAGTNSFQLFSKMETIVHQRDQHGNLVPGLYQFDLEVIETGTNLFMPVADLISEEVTPGIQVFSFTLEEPGNFTLIISDKDQSKSISNVPYNFTVFIGYCDGTNSIVNGSGLNESIAGEVARFRVILKDAYEYPAPVELEMLKVEIVHQTTLYHVEPSIYAMPTGDGTSSSEMNYGFVTNMGSVPAPSITPVNSTVEHRRIRAFSFDVIYTPKKSGIYEISVFCANIPLNGGHAFIKDVISAPVNLQLSGLVRFERKVTKMKRNEIVVQLMDAFSNPVLSQQSNLKLQIASLNKSGFTTWRFENISAGLYSGWYLAEDIGIYEICASLGGNHILPCPFGVDVYNSEYFPIAYNDSVSVWEDESIAFDALGNDYFTGGSATMTEFSKPSHGSLLQYGQLLRYTPYKGFVGNDSFSYSMSDLNSNLASATVIISVLSIPPQFVSIPSQLQAVEDVISPRFGGFSGIEVTYSDSIENISVVLAARSGTVFLSPMLMQFWEPMWSELTVRKEDGKGKDLIMEGRLEVINFALQSIQYIGNENFYGNDALRVSTLNKNGVNDLDIPVIVKPMNDPPFIDVPAYIVLEQKNHDEGLLIFDRQRDKFKFFVGDPDLVNFPGNESQFLVMFSVEVSSGFLTTKLPAELISTTELKLKNSYQWQPLQTYVTISKHFMVNAKGLRFQGTISDCNSIMQHLLYHGEEDGVSLMVRVSDMGNYGCYRDCAENKSVPLMAYANVNLLRRRPFTSSLAHSLGSAIVIESILVLSLGLLVLYFTCKCAIVLKKEKRTRPAPPAEVELSQVQSSSRNAETADVLPVNATHFTGWCGTPLFANQASNFRKRSFQRAEIRESSEDGVYTSKSSSDYHPETPTLSRTPLGSGKSW